MVCEASEIDQLFQSLDADGGGSLDVAEIKLALKRLEEEAFHARQNVRLLSQTIVELVRAMRAAQAEWREARKAEDDAVAERLAQRQREADEKAAAEAEAAAARDAARAEKKAKAAADKAAADSRIEAKRRGGS